MNPFAYAGLADAADVERGFTATQGGGEGTRHVLVEQVCDFAH